MTPDVASPSRVPSPIAAPDVRLAALRMLVPLCLVVACGAEVQAGPRPLTARPAARHVAAPLAAPPTATAAADDPSADAWSADAAPRPPADPTRWPHLRISEVMTDPLLLDDVAGEYVEVVHAGGVAVAIDELELELPSGRRVVPRRPRSPTLRACDVLLLTPLPTDGAAVVKPLRLPNRAGQLTLRWRGVTLDVVQWTGHWPWPRHKAGLAIVRRQLSADGRLGASWRHARQPLRGVERGSPGMADARCPLSAPSATRVAGAASASGSVHAPPKGNASR